MSTLREEQTTTMEAPVHPTSLLRIFGEALRDQLKSVITTAPVESPLWFVVIIVLAVAAFFIYISGAQL